MTKRLIVAGLTLLLVLFYACNDDNDLKEKVIQATEVNLEAKEISLVEGDTKQLVAEVLPEDTKDKTLQWESSDKAIVSVSEAGLITALKVGNVVISAKSTNNIRATCNVSVTKKEVAVTGLKITSDIKSIGIRDVIQLTAQVIPANASNDLVEWHSSDEAVAFISLLGEITGQKEGTVTITAMSRDGNFTDECTITVKEIEATYVKIDPREIELEIGDTRPLVVTFTPANTTNQKGEWWSKDESIAKVSQSGVVTAVGEGAANIVFCHNNNYDMITTCNVTVKKGAVVEGCTDADGREYKTVKIGNQEWMAENLAYIPETTLGDGAFIYDYEGQDVSAAKATDNYKNYGVLYEYDLILKTNICPKGWHIPTDEEFKELQRFLGMSEEDIEVFNFMKYPGDVARKLKSADLWEDKGEDFKGTNETGFNLAPGGMKKENGICLGLTKRAVFWTTTETTQDQITHGNPTAKEMIVRKFYSDENGICRFSYPTNRCYSVRCVKNK